MTKRFLLIVAAITIMLVVNTTVANCQGKAGIILGKAIFEYIKNGGHIKPPSPPKPPIPPNPPRPDPKPFPIPTPDTIGSLDPFRKLEDISHRFRPPKVKDLSDYYREIAQDIEQAYKNTDYQRVVNIVEKYNVEIYIGTLISPIPIIDSYARLGSYEQAYRYITKSINIINIIKKYLIDCIKSNEKYAEEFVKAIANKLPLNNEISDAISQAYKEGDYQNVVNIVEKYNENFDKIPSIILIIDSYARLGSYEQAYNIMNKGIENDSQNIWRYMSGRIKSDEKYAIEFIDTIANKINQDLQHANTDQINFIFSHAKDSCPKVISLYERIKGNDKETTYSSYIAGLAYYQSEDYPNAIECLSKVQQECGEREFYLSGENFTEPIDCNKAYCVLGLSHFNLCEFENAVLNINKIPDSKIQSYIASIEKSDWNIYIELFALINESLGNYEKALMQNKLLASPDNENGKYFYGIGCCYMQMGKKEEALENINISIKMENSPEKYYIIPWAYLAIGNKKMAEKCAKYLMKNNEKDCSTYLFAGAFYERMGKNNKAKRYYMKAYDSANELDPCIKHIYDLTNKKLPIYNSIYVGK